MWERQHGKRQAGHQQAEIGLPAAATPDTAAPVAALRNLLPIVGQNPETIAACFGRKSQKRSAQIIGILATLKALGHIT